jgi:MFS transporter, FHS family, L-fucose permease
MRFRVMTMVESTVFGTTNGNRRVFAVAASLFAIWGIALWLYNSLFFKFSHFFGLGPVHTAWTLAAFHVAYVLLALPAVLFHRKFGFKLGILAGLCVFGIGAFLLYLAIIQHSSVYFLSAVVVIGSCGAWLDTSLNPLAAISGDPQTVVKRMNLAYTFSGAGLLTAYVTGVALLGKDYNLSSGVTAQWSARPYVLVGLGAILLAFLVEQIALPDFAAKGAKTVSGLRTEIHSLSNDKSFLFAAAAIGAYCAVLTIFWTASYDYQHRELPGHIVQIVERGWLWFAIGRLAGIVLMRWIDPIRLLQWSAGLCLIAIAVAAAAGGTTGWVSLISGSLFLSITYPTVFGSALPQNPKRIALASGFLVIAAGIGNTLSSLMASLSLDALLLNPRAVVLMALPFQTVILIFALRSHAGCKPACSDPAPQ